MPRRALAISLLFCLACGGASGSRDTTPSSVEVAPVTEAELPAALRRYHGLSESSAERTALRRALLIYASEKNDSIIGARDYEALIAHLGWMTDLLLPADFNGTLEAQALEPVALAIIEQGSPRGDESGVLSALRILRSLEAASEEAEPSTYNTEYSDLSLWGREVRENLDTDFDRVSSLLEVWTAHAAMSPAPDVLANLLSLHLARVDAAEGSFSDSPQAMFRTGMLRQQVLRVAPFDVAGVFLRHGDVEGAINALQRLGNREPAPQIVAALEAAQSGSNGSAEALLELVEVYREARPAVARGTCRYGLRAFRGDPRFPQCLARIAAARTRLLEAAGWYRASVEIADGAVAVYDEAIVELARFLSAGAFRRQPEAIAQLAAMAEEILTEREQRWPEGALPVERYQFDFVVGTAQMYAGNVGEAETRLQQSLDAQQTGAALMQLGLLQERLGRPEDAVGHYQSALDLSRATGPEAGYQRAQVLHRIADAQSAISPSEAGNIYQQARRGVAASIQEAEELEGTEEIARFLAQAHALDGVLQERLGEDGSESFNKAFETFGRAQELYATALSTLATSTEDVSRGENVLRMAQRQVNLDEEWRVYFALWVKLLAARAGQPVDAEVNALLRSGRAGDGWSGALARHGLGELDSAALLEQASDPGERSEAQFYSGVRALSEGEVERAKSFFEACIGENMVSFFEHEMAQQMLRQLESQE